MNGKLYHKLYTTYTADKSIHVTVEADQEVVEVYEPDTEIRLGRRVSVCYDGENLCISCFDGTMNVPVEVRVSENGIKVYSDDHTA